MTSNRETKEIKLTVVSKTYSILEASKIANMNGRIEIRFISDDDVQYEIKEIEE